VGALFLVGVALFAAHLTRQALAVRPGDPAGALAIFKSNTLAGALLFAALVAGHWRP
jgi:4-hydroxybenzoate polyprenyltransferase